MASIVTLGSVHELENMLNIPLCLTRLKINDVKVDSDTTNLYLQGRIKSIGGLVKHAKAPMFYKKVMIEEDETLDQMYVMLTAKEDSAEQFQFLKDDKMAMGDLLVVVSAKIELDPLFPSYGGANVYQAIVSMSSPDCRVLLVKTSHDGACTKSKHPEKRSAASAVLNQTVPNSKCQRKEPYPYVKINNLAASSTVNVYGVVRFVKDPRKTRGIDYSMVITLVDESANSPDDKLKCVLFGNVSKLPSARPGNIIRFHRLRITTYENKLQGQNGPGFSWVVFDGAVDAPLSPSAASHENNTITQEDEETVRRLRLWAASEAGMLTQDYHSNTSLSDISIGQYFDLICQVVGTCVITDGESLLLKIWDGTQVKITLYEQIMSEDIITRLSIDERLAERARHYVADVWVFDEHFNKAKEVKPGDFIKLRNLHAMKHKPRQEEDEDPDSLSVELCLHHGYSYGRSLTILDPASNEVDRLQQLLDRSHAAATDVSANSIDQLWSEAFVTPRNVDQTETTDRLIPIQNNDSALNSDDLGEYFTPLTQPPTAPSSHQSNRRANTLGSNVEHNTLDGEFAGAQQHVMFGSSVSSTRKCMAAISGDGTVKCPRCDVSAGLENGVATREEEKRLSSVNRTAVCVVENFSSSENKIARSEDENMFSSENDLALTGQIEPAENEAAPLAELQLPPSLGFAQDRCMLNTATVITGHHHMRVTAAMDILEHAPPYKFRFQGYAHNYKPKSETASGFLQLYCDRCRYLSPVPVSNAEDQLESLELTETRRIPIFKSTEDEINMYLCPDCRDGVLEYIFMMEFIISDGDECICVGLWRQHANNFFGCTPVDLLRNPRKYRETIEKLNLMCFGQRVVKDLKKTIPSFEPQKMECCLMSYRTSSGVVAYQIFDTAFAVDF